MLILGALGFFRGFRVSRTWGPDFGVSGAGEPGCRGGVWLGF